jgi:hypothetical protein
MSKWRDLICCCNNKQKPKYEKRDSIATIVHQRGDTIISLEDMLKTDLINKRIVTHVRPRVQQEDNLDIGR